MEATKFQKEEILEEEVLRRVFLLCLLNSVPYATYRQELNPGRSSELVSAADYALVNYNYACIRRKNLSVIIQSIVDQPGPKIEASFISALLERWSQTHTEVELPSYTLCLQRRALRRYIYIDKPLEKRPYVIIDKCPRNDNVRVCFLLTFLKIRLSDLMGDSSYENLLLPAPQKPEQLQQRDFFCVACFTAPTDCILKPCNHLILCMACYDTLQPKECLMCRNTVEKAEKVYVA